jgi:hypothetical protein
MYRFLSVFLYTTLFLPLVGACTPGNLKRSQTISFAELPPQNFMDSSLLLTATASSGLPVTYGSSDSRIALVEGDVVRFVTPGVVYLTARQAGDDSFYEAPDVVRELRIRDWDPRKRSQTISFELPEARSNDDPPLILTATASSGLPVHYTSSNSKGILFTDSHTGACSLILYHGPMTYDLYLTITASQAGDAVYNPADNVSRTIHAIGDGTH